MSLWKPLIALSVMLLTTASLAAEECRKPVEGPVGLSGDSGPTGPFGATGATGATGAAGVNPASVNAWAQSDFVDDNTGIFTTGDSIPFNETPNVLNGITYTDPNFTLTTAGTYQATFEGYIAGTESSGNMGFQFFLNGTAVGDAYTPIPNSGNIDPPYLFVTQAIFTAAAGDLLSVRVIGTSGDLIAFDIGGGGASADVKIVKIANP